MSRLINALLSGICLGCGVGSAFLEYWAMSAVFFCVCTLALFLFVRSCLRRVF